MYLHTSVRMYKLTIEMIQKQLHVTELTAPATLHANFMRFNAPPYNKITNQCCSAKSRLRGTNKLVDPFPYLRRYLLRNQTASNRSSL